jgi:hypothetical protein
LKEVEQGKLRLDQAIPVAASERVARSAENTALWQKDSNRTLREIARLLARIQAGDLLPEGRGHLAVAVLVAGSRKPIPEQERLIARIARAAYDAFAR